MVSSNKISFVLTFASFIALVACGSGAAPETPVAAPAAGAAGASSSLPPGSQAGAGQGQAGSASVSAAAACKAKATAVDGTAAYCATEGERCAAYKCCAASWVFATDPLCGDVPDTAGQAGSDQGQAGSPAIPVLDCDHFGAACTGVGQVCASGLLACCVSGKMGDKDVVDCLPSQGGAGAAGQGQAGNGASGAGTGGSTAAGNGGASGSSAGASGAGAGGSAAGTGGSTSGSGGTGGGASGSGTGGSSTAGAPQGGAGGQATTTEKIVKVRIHIRGVKNATYGAFGETLPQGAIGPYWTASPNAVNTVPNGIDWELEIEEGATLSLNGQVGGTWDFPFVRYGKAAVALWGEYVADGAPLPPFTVKNNNDQWGTGRLEIKIEKASTSADDADGDGYVSKAAGGDDCNDDPKVGHAVHPGQVESFGADINGNAMDLDCDGVADPLVTVIVMAGAGSWTFAEPAKIVPMACGRAPLLRDVEKWDGAHTYPMVEKAVAGGCIYHTAEEGGNAIPIDQRPTKFTVSWSSDGAWSSQSWKGYCEANAAFQGIYAPLGTPATKSIDMLGMVDKCVFGANYLYN